jgi:hypothetical protein
LGQPEACSAAALPPPLTDWRLRSARRPEPEPVCFRRSLTAATLSLTLTLTLTLALTLTLNPNPNPDEVPQP